LSGEKRIESTVHTYLGSAHHHTKHAYTLFNLHIILSDIIYLRLVYEQLFFHFRFAFTVFLLILKQKYNSWTTMKIR
jgi:hypothetical protein